VKPSWIREAELLQAIARVNRPGFGKRAGIVVDYYGVARHLKEALAAYSDEDVRGTLQNLKDEVPILRDRYARVVSIFHNRGIETLDDTEACVALLADDKLRAEFTVKLKPFLDSLDLVLPRPDGLPFTQDAKRLAFIHARARNRYKDMPVLGKDVGSKVRKLIDDHVISLGIDPKIPPISLTDAHFDTHVSRQANDRAKASEMEHAIRSHIRQHLDEDPVLYRKLSERLKDILDQLNEQWDALLAALRQIIDELRTGQAAKDDNAPDLRRQCARPARPLSAFPAPVAGNRRRQYRAGRDDPHAAGGRDRGDRGPYRQRTDRDLLEAEQEAGSGCAAMCDFRAPDRVRVD